MTQTWTDFKGQQKLVSELDQQHLSNIYWFNKILHGIETDFIKSELEERFNGQLLEYRPHISYKAEIQMLQERGYLIPAYPDKDKDGNDFNLFSKKQLIYVNGVYIGQILEQA